MSYTFKKFFLQHRFKISEITLSEYISRAPFSLERMSFNETSKAVVYKGEYFHPTLARNFDVSEPLDFAGRSSFLRKVASKLRDLLP